MTGKEPRGLPDVGEVGRAAFTENDADEVIRRAFFDAAEALLGWPAVGEDGWTPMTQRPAPEMREVYLTIMRLAARQRHSEPAWGKWARHFGASWAELAASAGVDESAARERYAIPERNRGERFLPQDPEWCRGGVR